MKIPEYITKAEVQKFCKTLKIRDWTKLKTAKILPKEAKNNHPLVTGKIVIAHLKESLDYYKLLEVAELEGDLHKAIVAGDTKKIKKEYKKLALAKIALAKTEAAQVK